VLQVRFPLSLLADYALIFEVIPYFLLFNPRTRIFGFPTELAIKAPLHHLHTTHNRTGIWRKADQITTTQKEKEEEEKQSLNRKKKEGLLELLLSVGGIHQAFY